MCAWRCRRLRAAPGDRCRADAACKFLARAPIKGAALLWFGDTRLINTPVHAADERRVECSLAGANPDAGRPFPGPFWDVKALKNPHPTPGLNSNPKMQLRTRGGFLNLKSKLHLSFTNVPLAVH